jgi:hypothetical protein
MTKKPEKVLVQNSITASRGVEETSVKVPVKKQHGQTSR